jgi:hypothetical protein
MRDLQLIRDPAERLAACHRRQRGDGGLDLLESALAFLRLLTPTSPPGAI